MCFLYLKRRSLNSGTFTCKAVDKRESDIACPGHSTSGILVIFLGIMVTLFLFLLHSTPSQSYTVSANISLHHNRFLSETVVHLLIWKHKNIWLIHFYLLFYFWSKLLCPCVGRNHLCCVWRKQYPKHLHDCKFKRS